MNNTNDHNTVNDENIDNYLPSDWPYEIIERQTYGPTNNIKQEITLKVALFSPEAIKSWVKILEEQISCNYSIRSTENCSGQRVKFKQRLYCQHNTRTSKTYNEQNRTKNTNCPSFLNITLYAIRKTFRGNPKNAQDPKMPCVIRFVITHNHDTVSARALRFRKVADDTKQKLIRLYTAGHTPATALHTLKTDIQLSSDDSETRLVDRSVCPDYNYCYRLFMDFKKLYKSIDFEDVDNTFLIKKLKEYNETVGEECVMYHINGSTYTITLCPPLIKRIHENIDSASEIVFMNAITTMAQGTSKVLILSTNTQCGELPLGIIITSSETAENISVGFDMMKKMLGNIIFNFNEEGPRIFITDDSKAQRTAVQSAWQRSECFLSTFHVLQTVYRWLMSATNGILKKDGLDFFKQFTSIMYAADATECEQNYNIAVKAAENYQFYVEYLQRYWSKRELWALCYRSFISSNGNKINKVSEAAMHLLKEKLLNRVKAFKVIQLVDFLLTRFIDYYKSRLLDGAHNGLIKFKLQTVQLPTTDVIQKIKKLEGNMYLVPSENSLDIYYIVYTDILVCTCFYGNVGNICKHIDWIHMIYHSDVYNKKVSNIQTRITFFKIATGEMPSQNSLLPLDKYEVSYPTKHENIIIQVDDTQSVASDSDIPESLCEAEEDEESLLLEGHKLISNLSDYFMDFLNESPFEVLPVLKEMVDRTKQLTTVNSFVSSCSTFASECLEENIKSKISNFQSMTTMRYKTNTLRKTGVIRGRIRKNTKMKTKTRCTILQMK